MKITLKASHKTFCFNVCLKKAALLQLILGTRHRVIVASFLASHSCTIASMGNYPEKYFHYNNKSF